MGPRPGQRVGSKPSLRGHGGLRPVQLGVGRLPRRCARLVRSRRLSGPPQSVSWAAGELADEPAIDSSGPACPFPFVGHVVEFCNFCVGPQFCSAHRAIRIPPKEQASRWIRCIEVELE
jgi:hypothetical protein